MAVCPYCKMVDGGFLSHLVTDIFNKRKVRLFYPLKSGISLGLFHACGAADKVFLAVGSIAVAGELILTVLRLF